MSREPHFDQLADEFSHTLRGRHERHTTRVRFEDDRRNLPIFAALVKAHGWNGLHMTPAHASVGDTAVIGVIR